MSNFKRSISEKFIGHLEKEVAKGGWWTDVLADPKLIVALRGTYLNVYWCGMSLFKVNEESSGLTVTTHEKYLIDPKLAGQVPLIDGLFDIESLIKRAFVPAYEKTSLKKMKDAAGYFSKTEKTGCHKIAVRNPNIIDVEITFPGKVSLGDGSDDKQGPRVDIASVEPWTTRNVAGDGDQLGRSRPRPYRPGGGKLFNQPPMVLVRMADEDGRRACPIKRCGHETGGAFRRVERAPGVEDETVAVRVRDLDAAPADLLSAAVDRKG